MKNKEIYIASLINMNKCLSRAELANLIHVTPATITNLCDRLLIDGLLKEVGKGFSCGGRNPVLMGLNPDYGQICSIEINKNNFKVAIFDLNYKIIYHTISSIEDFTACLEAIKETLHMLLVNEKYPNILCFGCSLAPLYMHTEFARQVNSLLLEFQHQYEIPYKLENKYCMRILGEKYLYYPNSKRLLGLFLNHNAMLCCLIDHKNDIIQEMPLDDYVLLEDNNLVHLSDKKHSLSWLNNVMLINHAITFLQPDTLLYMNMDKSINLSEVVNHLSFENNKLPIINTCQLKSSSSLIGISFYSFNKNLSTILNKTIG